MEPFDLSLHKVNLEEKDFCEQDSLNAFSDVYCYESDFQTQSNFLPVRAKKVEKKDSANNDTDRSLINLIHESNEEYYTHGSGRAGSHTYRLPDSLRHGDEASKPIPPNDESNVTSPANDARNSSLRAFTDTVDALALQTSVIGNANYKPVSADEVSRVVAETQLRLKQQQQQQLESNQAKSNVDVPDLSATNGPDIPKAASNNNMKHSDVPKPPSDAAPETHDSVNLNESGTVASSAAAKPELKKKSSSDSLKSSPRGANQQDWIPVPKEKITTSVEKNQSWFLRRAAPCSNPRISGKEKGELHVVGDNSEFEGDSAEMADNDMADESVDNTKHSVPDSGQPSANGHVLKVKAEVHSEDTSACTPVLSANVPEDKPPPVIEHTTQAASVIAASASEAVPNVVPVNKAVTSSESKPTNEAVVEAGDSVATFVNESVFNMSGNSRLKQQVDVLMKARAKLEGQLEVMASESKRALQQRADLQTQVAALQQQLKSQETVATTATNEREALASDMKTMKETRGRLEQVIVDAQKLIEDKDQDIRTLHDDVTTMKEANDQLHVKLTEVKREMQAKSSTAEDLKNKIAELYVQFETTNQTKMLLENEVKSVRSEVKTLSTAKQWYQEQLKLSQNAKNELHRETTGLKGELINKSTTIERLKADNVRLKQHLTDTQQRIIQEKQLLAQHLEAIEADMLEREAAFAQAQRERDALQEALRSRGHNPTVALQSVADGDVSGETLTNELDVRRLQNDVRRKQAHIAVLEHEQAELMKRLALSQESILERDQSLDSIEQKYVDAQVELKKYQQEVTFTGEALVKSEQELKLLQAELGSVKQEKQSFDSMIQNLKGDMSKVESSFHRIKQELVKKTSELERVKLEKEQVNEALANSTKTASAVTSSQQQPPEVSADTEELAHVHSSDPTSRKEPLVDDNSEIQAVRAQNRELSDQLEHVTADMRRQIETLQAEKTALEQQLASTSPSSKPPSASDVFEQTVSNMTHNMKELADKYKSAGAPVNIEDLVKTHRDACDVNTNDVINENCALKMTMLKLLRDSGATTNVDMSEEYKALIEQNEALVCSCRELESQLTTCTAVTAENATLTGRVRELETELDTAKRAMATSDEDRIMALTLELEKERGKLAGALQNYDQLKTHTGVLESLIASKESSSVEMTSQAQQEVLQRERNIDELQGNVKTLQEALQKEKSLAKELKKQLISEKGHHVRHRRQLETLVIDHEQMRVDYENKLRHLEETQEALEKVKASEQRFRAEYDRVLSEIQQYRVEIERLSTEVSEQQAKNPVLTHQMQTLEWQIQEKNQELLASSQQLQLVEDRQAVEITGLQNTIQTTSVELSTLRGQLSAVKQERNTLQARVTELRSALQATVDANKAGAATNIDVSALEQLLQQTSTPSKQSKPLSFLQATLSELRGEISTLQNQMEEHASTVQSSSVAWKELEQQVHDLREVCKSTAAERQASQSLLSGAAQAAASSPIAMATQAAARSQGHDIAFIPPLTVQLPANVELNLPPPESATQPTSCADTADNQENRALERQIDYVIDTGSSASSKHTTPERRLNTKAMPLNSIYTPSS